MIKKIKTKVKRRPSDFQWLFKILEREFPGSFIPPVYKTGEKVFDEATLVEQMIIFKKFLDDCLNNPEIRLSLALEAFLAIPHYEEFKEKKKELDKVFPKRSARSTITKKNIEFYRKVRVISRCRNTNFFRKFLDWMNNFLKMESLTSKLVLI